MGGSIQEHDPGEWVGGVGLLEIYRDEPGQGGDGEESGRLSLLFVRSVGPEREISV